MTGGHWMIDALKAGQRTMPFGPMWLRMAGNWPESSQPIPGKPEEEQAQQPQMYPGLRGNLAAPRPPMPPYTPDYVNASIYGNAARRW